MLPFFCLYMEKDSKNFIRASSIGDTEKIRLLLDSGIILMLRINMNFQVLYMHAERGI